MAFNVDNSRQRMIVYNAIIFIYAVNNVVNYGNIIKQKKNKIYYDLKVASASCMIIISMGMIYFEWNCLFIDTLRYKYITCFVYWLCCLLQIAALVHELIVDDNNQNEQVMIVGAQFLGISIPFILGFDIFWSVLDNIRYRILICAMFVGLSCFLYYIGYAEMIRKEVGIRWYIRLSEYGWLMNAILFLMICVTLLFRDKCRFRSPKFDGMILFIIGIFYVLSLGFSLSYPYGVYPINNHDDIDGSDDVINIGDVQTIEIIEYNDALLLIPICFLISYEIQLITNY